MGGLGFMEISTLMDSRTLTLSVAPPDADRLRALVPPAIEVGDVVTLTGDEPPVGWR